MMSVKYLENLSELEALYGPPAAPSLRKVARRLTPLYAKWILASRFCVVSTVGPNGSDGSPRGDDGPVAAILDDHTLAMPDWHGNNRIDSLGNIMEDSRISLMFMVPGSNNVVRVNGLAKLSIDDDLLARFEFKGKLPRTVMVVRVGEVYIQCARAVMRAGLWTSGDEGSELPTMGEILAEQTDGEEGGPDYDSAWSARAAKTMW